MTGLNAVDLQIKLARWLHISSAVWTMGLMVLIFLDVSGRGLLSNPIPGTKEIIQNSVSPSPSCRFRLPSIPAHAPHHMFIDKLLGRSMSCVAVNLLGFLVFLGMVWAFPEYIDAYDIGEYEGEVRFAFRLAGGGSFFSSGLTTFAYVTMIILDIQNRLINGVEAQGALDEASDHDGERGAA